MTTGKSPVIDPRAFASTMDKHWVDNLNNVSSSELRGVWEQMATAFNHAISAKEHKQWQILQPPTGSGKTQGTVVYCSLLAHENLKSTEPAGVLIISRLKSQCDELTQAINSHAGREVAYTFHTDSKLSNDQLRQAMILVITHAALIKAFKGKVEDSVSRWHDFANWSRGPRKLVVIGEALSGIVEQSSVNLKSLGITLGLARSYRGKHPAEVQALEALCTALEARALSGTSSEDPMWTQAPSEKLSLPPEFNLYALRRTMESEAFDELMLGTKSPVDQSRAKARIADTLRYADAILSRWAFYNRKGDYHSANTALLLIPNDAPPAVVLDATASQSELWELLGDRVAILPVPRKARCYANVTLHVARTKGVGRHKMRERADTRLPCLFEDLRTRIPAKSKTLLCVHRDLEAKARTYAPVGSRFALAHWGAIDGRNDWQDCDHVVLFGLQYYDQAWAKGLLGATQGVKSLFNHREPEVRRRLQQQQLSVSVIQAINRVRCRKVIDSKGNCAPTDAYIVLPPDEDGEAILNAVKAEMPGIQVVDWSFTLDAHKAPVRRGSMHEAIVTFMGNHPPGLVYLTALKDDLKIGDLKPIRTALNDATHALTTTLAAIGVTYVRQGMGRATKTYLLKAS